MGCTALARWTKRHRKSSEHHPGGEAASGALARLSRAHSSGRRGLTQRHSGTEGAVEKSTKGNDGNEATWRSLKVILRFPPIASVRACLIVSLRAPMPLC